MATKDFEAAIADFLDLGRKLQAITPLTGERVLDELVTWYRETRVDGAHLDRDQDMLLLQWGAIRPLKVSVPTDVRNLRGNDLKYVEEKLQYLDFTRQVFAPGEDPDAEFDDLAVQMSITLAFGRASGEESGSNVWISTPAEIEKGTREFREDTFVQSLVSTPAQTVAIIVGHCG